MVDHSRTDAPLSRALRRQITGRHYSHRLKGRQNTSIALVPTFLAPTPSPFHNCTSRFGSTHLDPFKNAMLESVAPEMSLTLNLCVLLPDPTEVAA